MNVDIMKLDVTFAALAAMAEALTDEHTAP